LRQSPARGLFETFGLSGPQVHVVQIPKEAIGAAQSLGGRVVLKALSQEIAHKLDVGGVRVGLNGDDIGLALEDMGRGLAAQNPLKVEGYLVQSMLTGRIEMILGLRRDPQLDLVILLGADGVQAELSHDSIMRVRCWTTCRSRNFCAVIVARRPTTATHLSAPSKPWRI
jgi:acyl-CoA synthetase (NDP forming)